MRIPASADGDAILVLYRDRIVAGLGLAAVVTFLPFAVNNFVQGRTLLGVITLMFTVLLAINAIAVSIGRDLPIPFIVVFVPMLISLPLSINAMGLNGMLWCYPAVLLFFFVLPRWIANLLSISVVALATPLVVRHGVGAPASIRFAVSLTLVIAFSNIFLSIIGALYKRLAEQAIRDPLTGLYNRRHMTAVIGDLVAHPRAGASLLLVDIDHFKKVNDEHGHAAGDLIIREVGVAAAELGSAVTAFRIGGEEFAVLARVGEDEARTLAEKLRTSVAASLSKAMTVTVSIGVAAAQPGEDAESWFKRADDALYSAKRTGRNRVCCAHESMAQADRGKLVDAGEFPAELDESN